MIVSELLALEMIHHMKVTILDENAREDLLDESKQGTLGVKDNSPSLEFKTFEGPGGI
jgi:hypothetical protein